MIVNNQHCTSCGFHVSDNGPRVYSVQLNNSGRLYFCSFKCFISHVDLHVSNYDLDDDDFYKED